MKIVKIENKTIINKTKKRLLNNEFYNTIVYENNYEQFLNVKKRNYDNYDHLKKLHEIEFPRIDKISDSLKLGEQSFGYQTYRRYKAWVVSWNDQMFIITHNGDRCTDVFCEKDTSPKDVYNFLYDYYKTIYSSDGSTDFEKYYPTWDNN